MRTPLCRFILPFFALLILIAGCGDHVIPGEWSPPGKTNPVIAWSAPAPITSPAPLTATQLDATANVAGTFAYTPAAGTVLAAGAQTLSTTFTPADSAKYNTVTASVTLTVLSPAKINPVITWPPPAPITNPAPLTATQLDATANVAGTFAYTPAAGTVLQPGAQTLSTVFTPTDTTDYNTVTATVTLTVLSPAKINPVITWATPAPITNPAPLTATQLDATANVAGTFAYAPAAGTVLPPGKQTLSTVFTPTDAAAYNSVTASVTLIVNPQAGCTQPPVPTGGSSIQPGDGTWLAVADTSDNRVLIFAAPFTTLESATVVLGQADFTSHEANQGCSPSANTLATPTGLAVDSAGNLYVADWENCRVLQYRPPFTTDMSASIVFGQAQLYQGQPCGNAPAAGSYQLWYPVGLAADSAGDLWISEEGAGRVTEYVPPFTNGMAPALSIGQTGIGNTEPCNGFQSTTGPAAPPTASTLCDPEGIAFDPAGDLWVGDLGNQRELEFLAPFSSGMPASVELGQPPGPDAFSATGCNRYTPDTTALCGPWGAVSDANGQIWIGAPTITPAMAGAEAVLEFAPPFSNGMLGEVTTSPVAQGAQPAANNVTSPFGLTLDREGNLIVVDDYFDRVLIFPPPLGPGMNASVVLGQPNMTSGVPEPDCSTQPVAASTFCGPWGVVAF